MITRLALTDLEPGMIAAENIITPAGQKLAVAGTTLTKQLINKIYLYRIDSVVINIPEPPVIPNDAFNPQQTIASPQAVEAPKVTEAPTRISEITPHSKKIITSMEFQEFRLDYLIALENLKTVFHNVISDKNYFVDTQSLVNSISSLFTSKKTITEIFDMINQMHTMEDSIYAHCINVAIICRMIGRWLHLDLHDLDILTCCGLLHDIGKLTISDEILNKPDKLSDEEFALIKNHPKAGYDLLRNQEIDNRIKHAVLLHHERYDGSGYPLGLTSEQLSDEAMIVAIADVYDAMTAARSYRAQLCPFEVIAKFEQDGFQKYHTKYIYIFLNNIASTYQSNRVMLNNGQACKIVMLNQHSLSRPIVQFDDGECIDLSTQKDLYIAKVL